MKWGELSVLLIGTLHVLGFASAQTTADCEGAIVLCGDWYSEENASFSTGAVAEYTGACNSGLEYPSVWYTFTVQEAGMLSFILTPNQAEDDYDWALFDVTNGGCAGISAGGASPEVECNSFGEFGNNGATGISTVMGGTGNSNGPGNLNGPPFNADLAVNAGETYALIVMNWTQSPFGYDLDFGFSTASLYDGDPPEITDVSFPCDLSEFTVVLSESIVLSTAELADFALYGPGGVLVELSSLLPVGASGGLCQEFVLAPANPIVQSGSYNLVFTDGAGSVEDACGNLGTGQFDFQLEVLTPPIGWPLLEIFRCEGEPVMLMLENGATQPADSEYAVDWFYDAGGSMNPEWLSSGLSWNAELDGMYEVLLETVPPCFSATGFFSVESEDCGLVIPNVITPNGDYLNQSFRVDGLENWPMSKLRIWNRWGGLVFEHADFGRSAGWAPTWDGTFAAAEGTYFYELVIPRGEEPIEIEDESGLRLESGSGDLRVTGTLTVLR